MKYIKVIFFLVFLLSFNGFSQNSVEIPNVFTPNNDGVNDVFYVRAVGYTSLKCSIFNRYGGLVYEYYGINGNWDGYTHAGIPCKEGVYFVIVEVTTDSGEKQNYQGNLHLTR